MAGAGRSGAEPKEGTGSQVAPGPGDLDALGAGGVHDPDGKTGQICFFADISGASEPFAAGRIHQAPGGETRPVVMTLFDEPRTDVELERGGCVFADSKIVKQIGDHREDFSMDLHDTEFPDGAVGGQLFGSARVC